MSYKSKIKQTSDVFVDGSKFIKLHKKGRQAAGYKLNHYMERIDNDEIDIIAYPEEKIIGTDKQRHKISEQPYSLGKRRG